MNPLQPNDRIVAIVPEVVHGMGFYNELLWVKIEDFHGKMRVEALQMHEQTHCMRMMFSAFAGIYEAMKRDVMIKLGESK